jgi:hypothetical protein
MGFAFRPKVRGGEDDAAALEADQGPDALGYGSTMSHLRRWATIGAMFTTVGCSEPFESASMPDAAAAGAGGGGTGGGGTGGGGTGGGGTGGGGTGGGAPLACGTFNDEFGANGPLDANNWLVKNPNAKVYQEAGELHIEPPSSGQPSHSYALSNPELDLRACSIEVEVLSVVAGSPNDSTYLGIGMGATVWRALRVEDGMLVTNAGSSQIFNSVSQKRWRVRSSGGTTHLETSDGGSWLEVETQPTPSGFAKARIGLGVEVTAGAGAGFKRAAFEYLRTN